MHECFLVHAGEGCALPSLVREIEGNRVWCNCNCGQADSAHGDGVSLLQFSGQTGCGDCEPTSAVFFTDAGDLADFLDDAGEHENLQKPLKIAQCGHSSKVSSRGPRGICCW